MNKRLLAIPLAVGLVLGLTACGDESAADIKREAAFAAYCKAAGGYVWYDDSFDNGIHCSFDGVGRTK